jgi:hypothetical protein
MGNYNNTQDKSLYVPQEYTDETINKVEVEKYYTDQFLEEYKKCQASDDCTSFMLTTPWKYYCYDDKQIIANIAKKYNVKFRYYQNFNNTFAYGDNSFYTFYI